MSLYPNDSDCPHADVCGGCAYRGVPYSEQLSIKKTETLAFLSEAGVSVNVVDDGRESPKGDSVERGGGAGYFSGVTPAPRTSAYRNRMDYSFGDEVKDGSMTLGLHRRGSYMSVIDTEGCLIVPPDFNVLRAAVLAWALASGHTFWHKRSRSGFLRNLVLRRGEATGELIVNLVTTSAEKLEENAFSEMIANLPLESGLAGVMHTIYDGRADTVACDSMKILRGRDHYFDEMLGLRFRVNALSFFQTNTSAVEAMFAETFSLLPELGDKQVFDIYCGTGAISLALARRALSVTGVEIIPESVAAAKENAALNDIANCRFILGDALEALESLNERPNMLVADPPRMGMHPKVLKKVMSYGLPELLYISCNPKTFARDMAAMQTAGYRLDALRAYDNFPFTRHTELVAHIARR
ncbi:MAG: 23S rRNA (uracil(1939)-C(5))-methyltransferase RlmD [Clostridiales Family XIII bacterium]|nr:23S rRNA (uracil(1939)-C(5))-methyltransferase RlmD [Clostridiales Family XIII bacterium]